MRFLSVLLIGALSISAAQGCASCEEETVQRDYPRLTRRMQPGALDATTGPKGPLPWGQINFIHTTDTHGWLEGHLKERNYGADWGDFSSFVKHMRDKADNLGVDLLLIDTGDLHDGNGLSDVTTPNGWRSNEIFKEIDFDLMTPGNNELYYADVVNETYVNFTRAYGDRYISSNVLYTPTNQPLGVQSKYFTTKHGLRIQAFGVIFDQFTPDKSTIKITPAKSMINETWFKNAVNRADVDLFLVIGHNPVRDDGTGLSTLGLVQEAIHELRSDVPIQGLGGHTHIRDFACYRETSSAMESGKYCETVGWLALSGIPSPNFNGSRVPTGVPSPTKSCPAPTSSTERTEIGATGGLHLDRRYLDWNRWTFAYHAIGSQDRVVPDAFDTAKGEEITKEITDVRKKYDLGHVYGCAPQTYCLWCHELDDDRNIYQLYRKALGATVVLDQRDSPRLIFMNNGSLRFDLVQGPFTRDDSYILVPRDNSFQFIRSVPYNLASQVIGILNRPRSGNREKAVGVGPKLAAREVCPDPSFPEWMDPMDDGSGSVRDKKLFGRLLEDDNITPGFHTKDDLGEDGDDTPHVDYKVIENPKNINASVGISPANPPQSVDLVFIQHLAKNIQGALTELGYKDIEVQDYHNQTFTLREVIPTYAEKFWQKDKDNCTVGGWVQ